MRDMSNIFETTRAYEAWLAGHTPIVRADLQAKHRAMAATPFAFLRATFYHWTLSLPKLCPELNRAPAVLAVGDIHVENFGTWRDAEARLIWGVNDFDEAHPLPYTHDLARLAASALVAVDHHDLKVGRQEACEEILDGYRKFMTNGGRAFVLAENNRWLRTLAMGRLREPTRFWQKMNALPDAPRVPAQVKRLLCEALPADVTGLRFAHRRAGLGSLGRPRFTALAEWGDACLAREAKALIPSACHWALKTAPGPHPASALRGRAVRSRDPFLNFHEGWVVRRLSPHCCRIELSELADDHDAGRLLRAMGKELANLHLGTPGARDAVLADLSERRPKWLLHAAETMAEATEQAHEAWRERHRD